MRDAASSEDDMTSTARTIRHPVRLTGELDAHLSRWLWLVKMFLAIPHYVVLAFLLLAFAAATVLAGVAILFTGRYPRSLFDFNVGVLRWNWRVGFYVYAALGTDRYPPFTLARTNYPADFDVAYPEHLSRGLVLVKWLLALPHLLIVGLIAADLLRYPWTTNSDWTSGFQPVGGYSVFNLLVVVAGFFLLITGAYPRGLFDLLIGINRWLYRVVVYVALCGTTTRPSGSIRVSTSPPTLIVATGRHPGPGQHPRLGRCDRSMRGNFFRKSRHRSSFRGTRA